MARLGLRVAWPVISPRSNWARHAQLRCAARTSTRASYTSIRRVTTVETLSSTGAERTILVRPRRLQLQVEGFRDTSFQPGCTSTPLRPRRAGVPRRTRRLVGSFPTYDWPSNPALQLEAGTKRLARLYARAELLLCRACRRQYHHWYFPSDSKHLLDDLLKLGSQQRCGVRRKQDGALPRTTPNDYKWMPTPTRFPH